MDAYLEHLAAVRRQLPAAVRYGVFDGAFAKKKFVQGVRALGLHAVSKLRCDADLRYLYEGKQKRRGARRQYDGKVDFNDLSRWQKVPAQTQLPPHLHLYTVCAHHKSLQRVVRVLLLLGTKDPAKPRYVLLMSTDCELDGAELYSLYKARFQMEFLLRDAKQWTGLSQCQARDQQALHFHFNASLSAVNLAKIAQTQAQTEPFSLA
jgi:hypothetical protein